MTWVGDKNYPKKKVNFRFDRRERKSGPESTVPKGKRRVGVSPAHRKQKDLSSGRRVQEGGQPHLRCHADEGGGLNYEMNEKESRREPRDRFNVQGGPRVDLNR